MQKHLSFWVGFFSAVIVAVPIAVGVWGAASEFARNMSILLFGAVGTLVAVLVVVLFLRDWILRRTLGTTRATMEDFANSIGRIAASIASGDHKQLEIETQEIAKTALGWYAWSSFYRWVIGSAIGLLLAFGAFTGTVLLFEQNNRLQEQTVQFDTQNEILTLSLASELRLQLQDASQQASFDFFARRGGNFPTGQPLLVHTNGCGLGYDSEVELSTVPSPSIIRAVGQLATRESSIRERVVDALQHLLTDSDGSVALGALMVLDDIGEAAQSPVTVSAMYIGFEALNLQSAAEVNFVDSYVEGFSCESCSGLFTTSIVAMPELNDNWSSHLSLIQWSPGFEARMSYGNLYANLPLIGPLEEAFLELEADADAYRTYMDESRSFLARSEVAQDQCGALRTFANWSLVVSYFE